MPIEYSYTLASVALFGVMILVQAIISNIEHSPFRLAGSRDGIVDKKPITIRAKRASQNMMESLFLFVPVVLIAGQLDRFDVTTALGAQLFFFGRLIYAPLYWLGVPWLRTLAWAAAIVGAVLVFSRVLPFAGGF